MWKIKIFTTIKGWKCQGKPMYLIFIIKNETENNNYYKLLF